MEEIWRGRGVFMEFGGKTGYTMFLGYQMT
jgi:hypothetical protein